MMKYIGKKIEGRYEITELIGDGGMANVYKATDVLENKTVAVKILKDEFLENEEFVRRFKNESKAIALLNHKNIVRVYDVSFSEKMMSIVMEYVEGVTLKDYIDLRGALPWKDSVFFITQTLRALQHAHDNGIVHRDVKPQNIMITADGTIKVMDFGIARFSRSGSKTITDKAIGSVHYISPEQACSSNTDEKSDIYSVGVMLFELLTGKLPFEADSAVSVAIKQMQETPPKPTEINAEIPEGLEEIVLRAMQKDPSRRYQSAAEMLRDIDEFKKNPSISFEYKYFGGASDQATRYFDAVKPEEKTTADNKKNKKFISTLLGITAGFLIVALLVVIFNLTGMLKPKAEVEIGDLTGLYIDDVKADEQYKSITFKELTEYNNDFEKGQIINHNKKNKTVKEGSTVEVTISLGAKLVKVLDVYGLDSGTAEQKLTKEGFIVKTLSKFDLEIEKDHVVNTKPARNESVPYGSEIVIYVSLGAPDEYTSVPDLSGMTKDKAKEELEKFGLEAVFETVDSTLAKDQVVSQKTEAETQVKTGSAVIVQISSGKAPVNGVTVNVPIPEYMNNVTLLSYLAGQEVDRVSYIPSQVSKETHQVTISGSGVQTLIVYIGSVTEGNEYRKYTIDFNKKTVSETGVPTPLSKREVEMPYSFNRGDILIKYFDGTSWQTPSMKPSSKNVITVFGTGKGSSTVYYKEGENGAWKTYGTLYVDFSGSSYVSTSINDL